MVNNEIITADKANMMSSNIDIIEMNYYLYQTKYILYDFLYMKLLIQYSPVVWVAQYSMDMNITKFRIWQIIHTLNCLYNSKFLESNKI